MALATLPVCLHAKTPAPTKPRMVFMALSLGLAIVILGPLTGCGSGEETGDGPIITDAQNPGGNNQVGGGGGTGGGSSSSSGGSSTSTSGAASASLSWTPVSSPDILGYIVHYGTSSPGSPGSCTYSSSTFSSSPFVTVTGLAPNTTYFFAVSAYNGLESACSSEVATVTGSA